VRRALVFGGLVLLVVAALGFDVLPGRMPADRSLMRDSYHLAVICERWGTWLREGSPAIWMPEFAGGHPVHSLWMYGLAHPASLLWAVLPIEMAYVWGGILHVAFGGAGIYAYLRTRGARWEAAFAAGALFVLSEFVLVKIGTGGVNQLWALAWAPWVLRAIERAVSGERGATPALGLWAGAALLAGHVQVWIFVGPVLLVHAVVSASGGARPGAAFKRIALGGVLALAISAVQWLPALELIHAAGSRPDVDAELLKLWSAPAHVLAAKLLPGVLGTRGGSEYGTSDYWGGEEFDHEQAGLTGAWTLLLVLLALRRHDPRRTLWFVAAGLGFVAALGFHTLGTGWLNSLPVIGWSRTPARAQMLTLLGGTILAGHGISDWIEGGVSRRRLAISVALTVGAVVAAAFVLLRFEGRAALPQAGVRERIAMYCIATAVLVTAIPIAIALGRRYLVQMPERARWSILVVLAVPLFAAPRIDVTDTDFLHIDWAARMPAEVDGHRVHIADFRLPYVERQGLRTFRRPAHVEPRTTRIFLERIGPATAAWMDVGATLVHPTLERGPPTQLERVVQILPPQVAPHGPARLYVGAAAEPTATRALDRLATGEDVLLTVGEGDAAAAAGPAPGAVRPVATGSPLAVAFDVETPADATLFVSEKWYPGWEAEIDGAPVTIERANVAFRSVRVPAGSHRVTMRYRPWTVLVGAVLASLACLIAVLGCILALRHPPEAA